MNSVIDEPGLHLIFRGARTHGAWTGGAIPDETLSRLYDLTKMGPTSANRSPGRFVFARSAEAKERLRPGLSSGNTAKTMSASVTVIVAYDQDFYEKMPELFPHEE